MKDTVYILLGNKPSSVLSMMIKNFSASFSKNGLKTSPLFLDEVLDGRWIDNAFALIVGGAESTIIRRALSPDGFLRKDIIQDANQRGVHYVGFCGGAFMAWESISFQGDNGYSRGGEGFGLYPRDSLGAPSGFTPKNFTGMSDSAAIISLKHIPSGKFFHSLYC